MTRTIPELLTKPGLGFQGLSLSCLTADVSPNYIILQTND